MSSDSGAQRNPFWLLLGLAHFALAFWGVADGEPFWWREAIRVAIGVFFVGVFVFPDSEALELFMSLVAGLLFALTPDQPWWLRVAGVLMVAIGLALLVRAVVRTRQSKHERSRESLSPT